jgi:RNA polymerase sigma-70 factor (ECF subfamily)
MSLPTDGTVVDNTTTRPPTDKSLIRHYRSGDESAATSLYLRYAARLRALAREYCPPNYAGRFDPDDVLQSVFRTFFQGTRRGSYDVPRDGELWGLLMVLTLNKIRSLVGHHRAGKRAVQQTAAVDLDRHAAPTSDDSALVLLRMVLDEQLAGLPESNRDIVRLRIEGYEVGEIVERTGRSRRTVERVLQQFRDRMART